MRNPVDAQQHLVDAAFLELPAALNQVVRRSDHHRRRLVEQKVEIFLVVEQPGDLVVEILVRLRLAERDIQLEYEMEITHGDIAGDLDRLVAGLGAKCRGDVEPHVLVARRRLALARRQARLVGVDALLQIAEAEIAFEAEAADAVFPGHGVRRRA